MGTLFGIKGNIPGSTDILSADKRDAACAPRGSQKPGPPMEGTVEIVEGHALRVATSVFWQPCPGVAPSRFCKTIRCFARVLCKTFLQGRPATHSIQKLCRKCLWVVNMRSLGYNPGRETGPIGPSVSATHPFHRKKRQGNHPLQRVWGIAAILLSPGCHD